MTDSGTAEPATTGKRSTKPRTGSSARKNVALLVLVLIAAMTTLMAGAAPASSTTIPAGFFVVTDAQGANDVPGQVDLTQFGRDDTSASQFSLFWSWDAVDFTGQTGDACALFDYNGNGNIDAAVCSEIHNGTGWSAQNPVITQTVAAPNHGFAGGPPYVFTCSDAKNDRCAQPSDAIAYTSADIQSGVLGTLAASPPGNLVSDTDPFGASAVNGPGEAYPNDSTIQVGISKSFLGTLGTGTPALVNVCSYPSAGDGGNNNPFDCIVNPGGGFLKIVKVASGNDAASTTFTFGVNPGNLTKTIVGSGTTGGFPLVDGSGYSVAETALSNWALTSASCTLEGGGSANTGQTGNTLTGVTVQSGKITTCTFNNTENNAVLSLSKTDNLNPAKYDHVGQLVTYTLTATNSGNVPLHNVTVSDAPALDSYACSPSIPAATLAPGASVICMGTHAITQADLDAGSFLDTASATSTEANAPNASDTVFGAASKTVSITKTPGSATYDHVGQVVSYSIVATNTGNVTQALTVKDTPALDGFSCTPANGSAVAPGASMTCTGSLTITQANLDAGSLSDTACVDAPGATEACAPATVNAVQSRTLAITKTPSTSTYSKVGDKISYTIVATNTGNVTQSLTVKDTPALDGFSCTPANGSAVAPGASTTCTGSLTITQADLDAGSLHDTACVDAAQAVEVCAPATVTAGQSKTLAITKTPSSSTYSKVGDKITYTIVATNTGNVTQSLTVKDTPALDDFSCTPANGSAVAPGGTVSCTGTSTITQADLDAGSLSDLACVDASQAVEVCAPATVTADQGKALLITKTPGSATYDHVGQVVSYSIVATNTGNVTQALTVKDTPALDGFSCTPANGSAVAPGASITCTGSLTITQADLDAGSLSDTACVDAPGATEACAPATVTADQSRILGITKTPSATTYSKVGDKITYTIVATNTGNVTQSLTVKDTPALDDFSCTPANGSAVAPGGTISCTGTSTITQADLDAGSVHDLACVSALQTDDVCAPATVDADKHATLAVTKTDDLNPAKYDHVGQVVTYTLTAKNTGNVTLHQVSVSDSPALDGYTCTPSAPVDTLAPGDSVVCAGTHAITQGDIDAGSFDDTAHATSTETDAPDASDTVFGARGPALLLTKTDNLNPAKYDHVGQVVTYTLTAKNTGNVTLHGVSVSDNPALVAFTCGSINESGLAPGDSVVCTGTHAITQGDLDAGSFKDTASATSEETDAPDASDTVFAAPVTPPPAPPAPPVVPPVVPAPVIDLQITKADSPDPDVLGNKLRYLITVKNNGPDTAHNVQMSDPLPIGVSFSSVATSQGACTGGQVISCQLGTINNGSSVVITVFVKTLQTGLVTNTATTVGQEAESNTANNTASATTLVKGPFKPPVITGCYAVAVSPHSLSAGKRQTLTLKVRTLGKPAKGARVRVTGAGVSKVSERTNARGIVKVSVKPAKPGIMRFQPIALKGCSVPRIGVIGAFTPPVTG